jgi:hypothetical protein
VSLNPVNGEVYTIQAGCYLYCYKTRGTPQVECGTHGLDIIYMNYNYVLSYNWVIFCGNKWVEINLLYYDIVIITLFTLLISLIKLLSHAPYWNFNTGK